MGTPDPSLRADRAHDILAAEEFEVGTGDPALRHDPVTLPEELPGPRDLLAAEEYAVPAGRTASLGRSRAGIRTDREPGAPAGSGAPDAAGRGRRWAVGAALVGAVAVLWRGRH